LVRGVTVRHPLRSKRGAVPSRINRSPDGAVDADVRVERRRSCERLRPPRSPHSQSSIKRVSPEEMTKGGEALAVEASKEQWFALWTHSHCEQLVHDQLAAKGFHVFLPTVRMWSR